jgi:hypothetical protein
LRRDLEADRIYRNVFDFTREAPGKGLRPAFASPWLAEGSKWAALAKQHAAAME